MKTISIFNNKVGVASRRYSLQCADNGGLAASGSAALLDAGDLPSLLPLRTAGGEVEILSPRLEDVESSGGMRNLNPYVVTGCFFYMH